MARAKTNKLYRTFVKGLITEASPLTYPEDASTDELNTIISRKGNRTRRQGIRYENNFVMNSIFETNGCVTEYVWHSAAKLPDKKFITIQLGRYVHFWNMDESPVSDNKHPYILDLAEFKAPSSSVSDVENMEVCFSSGAGYLFIAHPKCDPIVIEYKKEGDTFLAVRVVIQVRDFEGVYDGLANDEEPYSLSNEHQYNLRNQGWVSTGTGSSTGVGGGSSIGGGGTYYDPYTGGTTSYNRFEQERVQEE